MSNEKRRLKAKDMPILHKIHGELDQLTLFSWTINLRAGRLNAPPLYGGDLHFPVIITIEITVGIYECPFHLIQI